jgi:predicted GIY-YIG superfamily endonuclease
MSKWFVYITERKDKLYVGITTDLDNRMRQHRQAAPPHHEGPMSKAVALKRERTLNRLVEEKETELDRSGPLTTDLSLAKELRPYTFS